MASSNTGNLEKEFLDNAWTIPVNTIYSNNNAETWAIGVVDSYGVPISVPVSRFLTKFGSRKQRTWARAAKGNVWNNVSTAGTSVTARGSFTSSSEANRGRRLEYSI